MLLNRFLVSVCLISVGLTLGCGPRKALTRDEVFAANFDWFTLSKSPYREVQDGVLDEIPARLRSLKAGMTPGQVFGVLKLPADLGCLEGSGDSRYYSLAFQFRSNRFMVMRFNMVQQPPSFIDLRLTGDGWRTYDEPLRQ
jgi:hypothetical protein